MAELFYKHYLITRFNLKFTDGLPKKLQKIDTTMDEKYLTERFRLFLNYTVPSIKNQTSKNFEWLVLFSDLTPYKFKKIIYALEEEMPYFKPLFVTHFVSFHGVIAEYMNKAEADFYITSRLDNDDAIANDYVEKVQEFFVNKVFEKSVLVFNDGFQLDEKKGYLFNFHYPLNHYSSFLQPFAEQKDEDLFCYPHISIDKYFKTTSIDTDRAMWMEVVHGTNVCNYMKVKAKKVVGGGYENPLKDFGLNINIRTNHIGLYVFNLKLKWFFNKIWRGIKKVVKIILRRK